MNGKDDSPRPEKNEGILAEVPTLASRFYNILAWCPILVLTLLLAVQVAFSLDVRALWFSDEVRHADVFKSLLDQGHWLILHLNGEVYPDKPPLYFLFLAGIYKLLPLFGPWFKTDLPTAMFLGTAVSGLLFLWATLALARFAAGADRRSGLAAGFTLLSGLFFMGLLHYARMDLLFSAAIVAAHVFLYQALIRERSMPLMLAGFGLAGVALLIKGPFGLALPLVSCLIFSIWRGRPGRLLGKDFLAGLILALLPALAWLAAAWFSGEHAFVENILFKQILGRAVSSEAHHAQPWFFYFWSLPLVWLPTALLIFFLPWPKLFRKTTWDAIGASRQGQAQGQAFLWCMLLGGFALLSAVSTKIPIYLLPVFAPLAVLCGQSILNLGPKASRGLCYSAALLLVILGLVFIIFPMLLEGSLPLPQNWIAKMNLPVPPPDLRGTLILGVICLLFAGFLCFALNPRRPEGFLLLTALCAAALSYPFAVICAPSLDNTISPKAQAEIMRDYANQGYAPAAYRIYPGIYSYYSGKQIFETRDKAALQKFLSDNPKAVLALSAKSWDDWADKPDNLREAQRQWIAEKECVLLVQEPKPELESAPAPEATPPPRPAPVPLPDQTADLPPASNQPHPEKPGLKPLPTPAPESEATPDLKQLVPPSQDAPLTRE